MNLISTKEAAYQKGVSRQAIIDAVKRGAIDGRKVSPRTLVVMANERFEVWQPSPLRIRAGKENRKKAVDQATQ